MKPPRWSSNLTPLRCGLAGVLRGVLRGGSLLIFLLAMGIWVRSYFVHYRIERTVPWADQQGTHFVWVDLIQFVNGGLYVNHNPGWQISPVRRWNLDTSAVESPDLTSGLGFSFYRTGNSISVQIPLWLFGLFAIPPLLWLRRYRRGRGGRGFPVEVKAIAA